jgi:hypothetical protein
MMTDIKMIIGSIKREDSIEACKLPVKYNHGKYADLITIECEGMEISLRADQLRKLMGIDKKR